MTATMTYLLLKLPHHNYIRPLVVTNALNYMIDEVLAGKTIFYDFYTPQEKAADPTKENAGLFYFRGEPGAPFAVINPGGGFSYVGSLHAGFPIAMEVANAGYNAFVLKYRTGGERRATEDLTAAISFILDNADELQVNPEYYSLWGGSAGCMMVTNIITGFLISERAEYDGAKNLPLPAVQMLAYTTYVEYAKNTRPLFSIVGDSDGLANAEIMAQRAEAMRNSGLDVEFSVYPNLGHGFALGTGTSSEGWVNNALRFWERYLR